MFGLIKKIFIGLLTSLEVNDSSHTKCVSLRNQKFEIQTTFINLDPNESSQEFHYYLFTVKLGKSVANCNTFNDLSKKVCVPNNKNLRFKSKRDQHNYRNKWIENINKAYIMRM